MISTTYIISQCFVILAIMFLGISYLVKDKKTVLFLGMLCSLFYGLEYLLLGAISGLLTNIISILRNVWFYNNSKKKKKNSIWVLIVLAIITIISGLFSYASWYSILPIIATILFTYSIWQDNIKHYRYLAIPISLMWIVYNYCYFSIIGVISECVLLIFEILGIIKHNKKGL